MFAEGFHPNMDMLVSISYKTTLQASFLISILTVHVFAVGVSGRRAFKAQTNLLMARWQLDEFYYTLP